MVLVVVVLFSKEMGKAKCSKRDVVKSVYENDPAYKKKATTTGKRKKKSTQCTPPKVKCVDRTENDGKLGGKRVRAKLSSCGSSSLAGEPLHVAAGGRRDK